VQIYVCVSCNRSTKRGPLHGIDDIDVLTKKFSDLSCVPSPPFQLLPSASTTGSLAIDCTAVEVRSPHVARTKGKRVSNRTMSAVEKAVVKKAGGNKKKQSDTNPNQQVKKKKEKVLIVLELF